jgi:hypothetical protein
LKSTSIPPQCSPEGRRDLAFRRDVGVDVEDTVTELLGERMALLVLDVDTCDLSAATVQHLHRAAPDAAAPAGDDRDLSPQVDHARTLLAPGARGGVPRNPRPGRFGGERTTVLADDERCVVGFRAGPA